MKSIGGVLCYPSPCRDCCYEDFDVQPDTVPLAVDFDRLKNVLGPELLLLLKLERTGYSTLPSPLRLMQCAAAARRAETTRSDAALRTHTQTHRCRATRYLHSLSGSKGNYYYRFAFAYLHNESTKRQKLVNSTC